MGNRLRIIRGWVVLGFEVDYWECCAYIEKKQSHCVAIWTMPSRPAKHAIPLISWQQATSWAVDGKTRMFAKAEVPDVTPRRTKYGDIPKELRRVIIRMCCGRYDTRMPKMIRLLLVSWAHFRGVGTHTRRERFGRCLVRPAHGNKVSRGP